MDIFALDTETTGLDKDKDQILHIALVYTNLMDATSLHLLPKWEALVRPDKVSGDMYALNMNRDLIEVLAEPLPCLGTDERMHHGRSIKVFRSVNHAIEDLFYDDDFPFKGKIRNGSKIVVAGKNAGGFDLPFIEKYHEVFARKCHHRVIDVGSMALGNDLGFWNQDAPPSLREASGKEVGHDAYEDALDVILAIRRCRDRLLGAG